MCKPPEQHSPRHASGPATADNPFYELAENFQDVFWVRALDTGQVIYVSPAYERIWGRTCQSLYENPETFLDAIHPDDRERVRIARGRLPQGPYDEEFRILRPDGAVRWIRSRAFPFRRGTQGVARAAGIAEDITARKHAEDERARLLEDLHQAQKMEVVGQLTGGIAHDFNNLLTAILGTTELLKDVLPTEGPHRAALDIIERAATQASGLTRGLLAFSQRLPPDRQRVDLARIVAGTGRLLRRMLPAAVELRLEAPLDEPLWVYADATQLQQVVMNLAINGRDAMPNGGTLHIAAAAVDPSDAGLPAELRANKAPWARLVVQDSGIGMTPDVRARMFEPFFTTKPPEYGTGLGLAITQRIVREHGGQIGVESRADAGTAFTVYLPCIAADAAAVPPEQPSAAPAGHGELVLLAEDDALVRDLIKRTLASLGYEVVSVSDGQAAFDCYVHYQTRTRLLILDVDLPRRSGWDCLHALRKAGAETSAILITGSVDSSLDAMLDRHTVLLRKPFGMSALGKLVGQMLGMPDGSMAPNNPR
jgi:two-component system cell cycle sensor histidine kinase/response regulator CckA